MNYTIQETTHESGQGQSTKLTVTLENGTVSAPQYFRVASLRDAQLAIALRDAARKAGVSVESLNEAA